MESENYTTTQIKTRHEYDAMVKSRKPNNPLNI